MDVWGWWDWAGVGMGASVFITIRMARLMVAFWRAGAHRDAIDSLEDEPDFARKRHDIKKITRM